MQNKDLQSLAQKLLRGEIDEDDFLSKCLSAASVEAGHSTLDIDRQRRCGFPEVIYGEGKSTEELRSIVAAMLDRNIPIFATRVSSEKAAGLKDLHADSRYNEIARTFRIGTMPAALEGKVAILSAGTSDRPVAEEVRETLAWMNVETIFIEDVGVAGPHRLLSHIDRLQNIKTAVVVAGMEGALPSVVGGHVDCPVIAVPTSVGYGASFDGLAALLGMLNSCAANVTVVNIDAGFKAAYVAGLIVKQCGESQA